MDHQCLLCIFNKERVETFSDGIFAIIITLLILDIKIPRIEGMVSSRALMEEVFLLLPNFLSWLLSFFTILVIWINHHRLFEIFKKIDYGIFWINAFLLLFVCFIPFPTSLMGNYLDNKFAVSLYGIAFGFMEFTFYVMRKYALKTKGLLGANINKDSFKKATTKAFLFGPAPYFTAAIIATFFPLISIAIYLITPIYFASSHSIKETLNL